MALGAQMPISHSHHQQKSPDHIFNRFNKKKERKKEHINHQKKKKKKKNHTRIHRAHENKKCTYLVLVGVSWNRT